MERIININLSNTPPPKPTIKMDGRSPYIMWGAKNLYPQAIAELLHLSTAHQAIIKLKSSLTGGEGFLYPEDYIAPPANPLEGINDVMFKNAIDKVVFNGYALQVVYGRGGDSIAEVYHTDFSTVRAAKPNEAGIVESYFICSDWSNTRKYPPVEIPAFNPANKDKRQLIYVLDYTPSLPFYPSPDYSAAINYINLDYEISKFHLNNVKNGLTPSLLINVPEVPTEEERRALKLNFEQQYRGSENAGKFLLTFSHGADRKITIDTISTGNNADIFNTLEQITSQKIITGHRLASPTLAGFSGGAGNLGSNGAEIVAAQQYFMSTVIKHYQKPIISTYDRVLSLMGAPVEDLSIINTQPIENIFSEALLADILTTDELRSLVGYEALEAGQPENVVDELDRALQFIHSGK